MTLRNFILFFLLLALSITSNAQIDKFSGFSNAKIALIIDSLEYQLVESENNNNADIYFELALLYNEIDANQSMQYAYSYLSNDDILASITNTNIIYSLLVNIHSSQKNHDSVYYYLSLQSSNLDSVQFEKAEIIKRKYLEEADGEKRSMSILGIAVINFVIILVLLLVLISITIYFLVLKKRFAQIESTQNQELELANTKLQKFNDELQQAIMGNTYERAIELEETSIVIVELRKLLKKAEESNYLKNAFLGTMSHQIRTPLSGIMGFSDMLETELALKGDEELYEFAKNIREAGEKLMSLITNIIDISSIEANMLELNIVSSNLNAIVSDVGDKYGVKAKEKGLIFKTKLDNSLPPVNIDSVNIVKVLNIILENAIQYTPKGFVTLSTSYDQKANLSIIEIKDKGVSIDKETMKMLIDSFDYSKHGSSLTYKGHGLGLILAHRLVTLMNGNLVLKSKLGVGTSVKISIPYSTQENESIDNKESGSKASIVNAPDFGRLNIFIVEDDRMNRMVLEKMLKKTGEVTTVADGDEALKKLGKKISSSNYYDVIMMDINLPAPWDGIKLMHEIRKRFPHTNNIPIIAQTAYAMATDKDLYLDAGFNDYISKPINKTELITMIQKQLELFRK